MMKELSLLKWQEKATKLAYEDNSAKIVEMQTNVSSLEESLKAERYRFSKYWIYISISKTAVIIEVL